MLIAVILVLSTTGAWLLYSTAHTIKELDRNYQLTEKGMSKAQVEGLMGQNGKWLIPDQDPLGFWDEVRMLDSERAQIHSSVSYTVDAFFLQITFEFSFSEDGKLIGRHTYD